MTITVTATSREQLDDLYRALSSAPDGQGGALIVPGAWKSRCSAASTTPTTYAAMRHSTAGARSADTPDALWICEHAPVYTQGLAGKADHVLDARRHPGRRRPTAAAR